MIIIAVVVLVWKPDVRFIRVKKVGVLKTALIYAHSK